MGLLDQGAAAGQAPIAPGLAEAAAAAGAPGPDQAAAAPVAQAGPAPAAPAAAPAAKRGGMADGNMPMNETDATSGEQAEYDRAMDALGQVLYSNEKISNSIVDQIDPEDPVGSTAKVSMLLIQQLDQKVDLDEVVVADITQETVSRIMELAEARHGIEYDDRDAQAILGATWEGVSEMFGVDEADHAELVNSVGSERLGPLKAQHEAALNG